MGDQVDQPSNDSATIVTTAAGWVRFLSPAAEVMLGWAPSVTDDHNWFDLIHPADVGAARRAWTAMTADHQAAQITTRIWATEQWSERHLQLRPSDAGLFAVDLLSAAPDAAAAVANPTSSDTASAEVADAGTFASATAATGFGDRQSAGQAATAPGSTVPERRVAARLAAGGPAAPMVEIDPQGRTVYVAGDWQAHVGADVEVTGPAALEALLEASGQADAVFDAIDAALARGESTVVPIAVEFGEPRWIKVVPIPAPNQAGVDNVLVALADTGGAVQPSVVDTGATHPSALQTGATQSAGPGLAWPDGAALAALDTAAPTSQIASALPTTPAAGGVDAATKPHDDVPPPLTLRERLQPAADWIERRQLDPYKLAFVAGVVLLALVLRTYDLSSLPTGFHGDEAIFGMESQRVLNDGSIGVYTGSALGQPTAPFYLGIFTVGFLGPTIWATRILAAIAGTITVAATYLVVQKRFGHRVGAASAIALAVMTWSIHFSRIAFGLAWWPLCVLMSIAAIDRATKSGNKRHWFIAGAISGFGVYVYNSHWAYGAAIALFMAVWLVWPNESSDDESSDDEHSDHEPPNKERPVNRNIGAMAMGVLGGVIVLFPMLRFMLDDKNGYFNHFNGISRRNIPEWTEASLSGKIDKLFGWYVDAWQSLLSSGPGDAVDASGVVAQIPKVFAILGIVGLVHLLRHHRTAFTGLILITIVVLPFAPALTINGVTRRDFAMAPLIAILAGVGAVALYDFAKSRVHVGVAWAVAAVIVGAMFITSVQPYFTTFRDNDAQQWVFANELTTSVDAIEEADRQDSLWVNWYSARHYYNYETLRFLLDGTPGTDRAPLDQGFNENPDLSLHPNIGGPQVYVLVGDYARNLENLQALYPAGEIVADTQGQPGARVVAYLVAAGNSGTG